MGRTLFVTTGATVLFKELVEVVLDPLFLTTLVDLEYTKLVIQYGISPKGEELFLKLLQKDSKVKNGDKWTVNKKGLTIEGLSFTSNIKSLIKDSHLVISHGGTGSILDVLRLSKKLIVVINSQLMDDHQSEIADMLSKNNHILKSDPNLKQLISNLKIIDAINFKPLPTPNSNVFQEILQSV